MNMNWTKKFYQGIKPSGGLGMHDVGPVPIGWLEILLIDAKTRAIVQKIAGENIVVDGGRHALAHLWAGDDAVNQVITQMQFGDGVVAPDVTDAALSGTVIITKPTTADFPVAVPDTKVRFTATVDQGEGNGPGSQNYTEAGLLTANNTLAAHRVFGLVTKTSDLIIQATWTFTF